MFHIYSPKILSRVYQAKRVLDEFSAMGFVTGIVRIINGQTVYEFSEMLRPPRENRLARLVHPDRLRLGRFLGRRTRFEYTIRHGFVKPSSAVKEITANSRLRVKKFRINKTKNIV
jgi:hypothetical protein